MCLILLGVQKDLDLTESFTFPVIDPKKKYQFQFNERLHEMDYHRNLKPKMGIDFSFMGQGSRYNLVPIRHRTIRSRIFEKIVCRIRSCSYE